MEWRLRLAPGFICFLCEVKEKLLQLFRLADE
jgi:hypothetical protein